MKRPLIAYLVLTAMLWPRGSASQQRTPALGYLCTNIAGSSMAAPNWKPEPDGAPNQQVVLRFAGNQEIAEADWSIGNRQPYYEAVGIGTAMRSGFSIVVFADEYVETYVYNAGTTELLFSSVRSGSTLLPNTIKSFRGSCKPVGAVR